MIQQNNYSKENRELACSENTPSSSHSAQGGKRNPAPICFGPFILDPNNALLLHSGSPVALTPKAFAVLSYLIEFAGELVTKDRLFTVVWSNVVVTEAALTVCIREIRKALNDSTRQPLYIETVHKRGFRFIGNILCPAEPAAESKLVGREAPLATLNSGLEAALSGRRQLIFITGEAGIGKTSLVDSFLARQRSKADYWIAKGQCIEHHGNGEPYLPVLDAVSRLCREHDTEITDVIARFAPSWLPYFPSLRARYEDPAGTQQKTRTTESMIREMVDALEAISELKPLILCLEDLHWCDSSTTEFLSFLARRRDSFPLLILGTLRPADTIINNVPLRDIKQDLQLRGICTQLPLEFLCSANITNYLSAHFSPHNFPERFAEVLHQQTDGNPLFMINVLADLKNSGRLKQESTHWQLDIDPARLGNYVPDNLQEMINNQIERLAPELQDLLEAAGIAGEPGGVAVQFTLDEAAAALDKAPADIERNMEQLAREGHFLRSLGAAEWPDGGATSHYEFTHALYQNVIYERTSLTRKIQLHKRIGHFLERSYGVRRGEIVNKLAVHFEQGREFLTACQYLCQSATLSSCLGGSREAVTALQKARQLLARIPQTPARDHQELSVLQLLAPAITAAQGNAAPEIETVYRRAQELCEQLHDKASQFPVLFGLRSFYLITGSLEQAHELAENLLNFAESLGDKGMVLEAHVGLASCHFYRGNLKASYDHAVAGIQLYDQKLYADHATKYGLDPGVFCYARAGQTAWALGRPDLALEYVVKGVAIAEHANHPYSHVFAIHNLTLIYLYRREDKPALKSAGQGTELALQHGFNFMSAWSHYLKAWAFAMQNDSANAYAEINKALKAPKPDASTTDSFLSVFLAECYWHLSDAESGLAVLNKPSQVHAYDAERLRLLAEFYRLQWLSTAATEPNNTNYETAENHYRQALALSEKQGAKAYSLRIAVGLSHLLSQQCRYEEAYKLLENSYAQFDKNTETVDMQEARQCLKKLSGFLSKQ